MTPHKDDHAAVGRLALTHDAGLVLAETPYDQASLVRPGRGGCAATQDVAVAGAILDADPCFWCASTAASRASSPCSSKAADEVVATAPIKRATRNINSPNLKYWYRDGDLFSP